jgi:hypothetical protein
MSAFTNEQLRRLLLRQLAPVEIERLEQAMLLEDGVAERLREEEFDLVDDYVHGRLSTTDGSDFDRNFLITPERFVTLRVARAMAAQRHLNPAGSSTGKRAKYWRPSRFQAFATAAGLAAVALLGYWDVGLRRPVPSAADVSTRALPAPPAPVAAQPPETLTTVTLLADTNRGGAKAVLHLGSGHEAIRLQVEVPEPQAQALYSVEVGSAMEPRLLYAPKLAIRGAGVYRYVELTAPAEALGPGSRTVTLRIDGADADSTPQFRWQIESDQAGATQKK